MPPTELGAEAPLVCVLVGEQEVDAVGVQWQGAQLDGIGDDGGGHHAGTHARAPRADGGAVLALELHGGRHVVLVGIVVLAGHVPPVVNWAGEEEGGGGAQAPGRGEGDDQNIPSAKHG